MTEKYALVTFAYPIVLRRADKDSSPIVAAPVRGCSSVHFEPNFRGPWYEVPIIRPLRSSTLDRHGKGPVCCADRATGI